MHSWPALAGIKEVETMRAPKVLKTRCSEMRFQANSDDIKPCNEVNLPHNTARAIIIGNNEKNKRLDDKKSPVDL
jgi:hypothetical protein